MVATLALAGAAALFTLTGPVAEASPVVSASELEARAERAERQAGELRSEIERRRDSTLDAEAQAAAASARERELGSLLASGREQTASLERQAEEAAARVKRERSRLGRARARLANRLVQIYRAGSAEPVDVALAEGYSDLITRADYMRRIERSDENLVRRVEETRAALTQDLARLSESRARAAEHQRRLEQAHSQIDAVSLVASARAADLRAASHRRDAALNQLNAKIDEWTTEIQRARSREARREASREEAEAEVERWLGGPYSIPTAIVICESGGNYSALNPSSGAGGAYQIIPSTWEAYGGKGAPHEGSKAEQDRIAARIWADSGPSAWVCKG